MPSTCPAEVPQVPRCNISPAIALKRMARGEPGNSMRRPFAQRYMILIANGRGAYKPIDLDSLDQALAAELVRRILQAARLEGWQVC